MPSAFFSVLNQICKNILENITDDQRSQHTAGKTAFRKFYTQSLHSVQQANSRLRTFYKYRCAYCKFKREQIRISNIFVLKNMQIISQPHKIPVSIPFPVRKAVKYTLQKWNVWKQKNRTVIGTVIM